MASPKIQVYTSAFNTVVSIPLGTAYYTPVQGDIVYVTLSDNTEVSQWLVTVQSCSDNVVTTDIVPTYSAGTYVFQMPSGKDCSFILQSLVNGGINSTGQFDSGLVYTFKVGCTSSKSILSYGETYEESPTYGYTKILNNTISRYNSRANDALTNRNLLYWLDANPARFTWGDTTSNFTDASSGANFNITSSTTQNAPQILTMAPYGNALMLSGDTSTAGVCHLSYSTVNNAQSISVLVEETEFYTTTTSAQRYICGRMNSANTAVCWGFFYETYTRKYGFAYLSGNEHQVMLGISPVGLKLHQLGVSLNTSLNQIKLYFNGKLMTQANASLAAWLSTYNLYVMPAQGDIFFGDAATATGQFDFGRTTYIHDARYYDTDVTQRCFQNIWESTL